MHQVVDQDGAVLRVTLTSEEWKSLHRDYKVANGGNDRQVLLLCPRKGTKLVPAEITADGLPAPVKRAALPVRFPESMIEEMRGKNPKRFAERQAAAEAILRTQFAVLEVEGTDAGEQLAAFVILATEADALDAGEVTR